jgi:hypothetical protein
MEVLKYYIYYSDYKNCILVNKEWHDRLVTMKGAMLLNKVVAEQDIITHIEFLKTLYGIERIKLIIDCFEYIPIPKKDLKIIYKYPMTWVTANKIKRSKTLRGIGILDW